MIIIIIVVIIISITSPHSFLLPSPVEKKKNSIFWKEENKLQ